MFLGVEYEGRLDFECGDQTEIRCDMENVTPLIPRAHVNSKRKRLLLELFWWVWAPTLKSYNINFASNCSFSFSISSHVYSTFRYEAVRPIIAVNVDSTPCGISLTYWFFAMLS